MSDGIKRINEHLIKDGRTLVMTKFISDTSKLAEGTIFIDYTSGELKYINADKLGNKTWQHFKLSNLFDKNTFDDTLIADNSLHAAKIIDGSIPTVKIANLSITTDKIADRSITNSKFNINSIDGDKIKDNSIVTSKIFANSITNQLIANQAISTNKIQDKAITSEKIQNNSIETKHINDKIITTSKIADKVIINALMADNSITSNNIAFKEVKTNNIDNGAITLDKIADGAVQSTKIPMFGIKNNHIDSIDGYKIFDNTITSAKIKNNSITTNLIADASITTNKLDAVTQTAINNSIKIQSNIIIDNKEHYNTALINGSAVLKNSDNSKVTLQVYGDINATGDITGARVFNPYFADIAEAYIPTCKLQPGDPVCLSKEGNLKVEKLNNNNIDRFLGFVSDQYATLFGADKKDIESGKMIAVTLVGRIKCNLGNNVEGKVGEYISITLKDNNVSFMITPNKTINSVGKLLENKSYNKSMVLCQLWT